MEQKCLTHRINDTSRIFVINGKNSFALGLKFVLITFIKQLLKRIKKTMSQKHRAFNNGIELSEQIAVKFPAIKMVIMTTFSRAGYIRRSLSAGVKGFILKEAPSDELINALKKVMQGQKVIDPELAINALDDADPLTDKERKALKLASDGLKTSEIAKQLFISEGTTRNYLSDAIAKLNATNRVDAARIARQKGWL